MERRRTREKGGRRRNALFPPGLHLPSELLLRVLRERHVDDAYVIIVVVSLKRRKEKVEEDAPNIPF
jgi:hypothetical protein